MIVSMTGFASARGQGAGASWSWDIRGVNGKGLDLRLRLPEGIEGLEQAVRGELTRRLGRGNVSVALKLTREAGSEGLRINPAALGAALDALAEVEAAARERGVVLTPPGAAEVLGLRGVTETGAPEEADTRPLLAAVMADFAMALDAFEAMRRAEGAALAGVVRTQIDRIAALAAEARDLAEARRDQVARTLRENLARVMEGAAGADPDRVAQELALLAVKADVTEELDRLDTHVAQARAHLEKGGQVGRKLDFLMQEFNREANTLCSKSQNAALTRVGLDLKLVIDQMREQIQNVE
ncbi:YicC/YloC family endoribonuclease [Acidimangrovimonas sediminis]|uniref:YicC/YloC family endoribonuclease n=1 Tax=Acidimangrovimonas sediminis TaxID=2056283 RepID=UPI000C7FFD6B|nr:YicC/YloC family endoribonuclease [Acidimangrovimonas sediminis]